MYEGFGEGEPYAPPQHDVLFGDIFKASFMLDVFVREDTKPLGGGDLPANLASKFGKWISQRVDGDEAIGVYSPALTPNRETRFALAHTTFRAASDSPCAILLSDSCLVATSLVQGRQRRSVGGRLLFAPLSTVSAEKWLSLTQQQDFGRFPLPADRRLPEHTVAEMGGCFMVDARDVKNHADSRVLSLGEALAEELEVRWDAYATRRGPLAYGRNTLKLASLLSGGGQPAAQQQAAADAIADTLDLAFFIEGSDLEAVSAAEEQARIFGGKPEVLAPPLTAAIVTHLRDLAALAAAAADRLEAS